MRENAVLGGFKGDCDVLVWLWEILEEYTDVQRASFHFFITGLQ